MAMRTFLITITFATLASSALAETGQATTDRFMQALREELAREDCLWRETLRANGPSGRAPEAALKDIAGKAASVCSQENRQRILQGTGADLSLKQVAACDQIWAQERALAIGQQLNQLPERAGR
jgi:hypothetical protein